MSTLERYNSLDARAGFLFETWFCLGFYSSLVKNGCQGKFKKAYAETVTKCDLPKALAFFRGDPETNEGMAFASGLSDALTDECGTYIMYQAFHEGAAAAEAFLASFDEKTGCGFRADVEYLQFSPLEVLSEKAPDQERSFISSVWKSQLDGKFTNLWDIHSPALFGSGKMGKADLVVLLGSETVNDGMVKHLLVVDLSVRTAEFIDLFGDKIRVHKDLFSLSAFHKSLCEKITGAREKSAFCGVNVDGVVERESDFFLGNLDAKKFAVYFKAFCSSDKPTSKLIQAGSYASSFLREFSGSFGPLSPSEFDRLHVTACGWTNSGLNALNVMVTKNEPFKNENGKLSHPLLDTCETIYVESYGKKHTKDDARAELHRGMVASLSSSCESYDGMEDFLIDDILGTYKEIRKKWCETFESDDANSGLEDSGENGKNTTLFETVEFTETIVPELRLDTPAEESGFTVSDDDKLILEQYFPDTALAPTVRDIHGAKIIAGMNARNALLLFLLGCPGVGKTTAVSRKIISDHNDPESSGTTVIYICPRIQVGRDWLVKFSKGGDGVTPFAEGCLLLRSDTSIQTICDPTREMSGIAFGTSTDKEKNFAAGLSNAKIVWKHESEIVEMEKSQEGNRVKSRQDYRKLSQDEYKDASPVRPNRTGVLRTVFGGIGRVLNEDPDANMFKTVVGAVSLQSLKKTGRSGNTIDKAMAEELFGGMLSKSGVVEKGRRIAKNRRNLVFMIDEITGSGEGKAFLGALVKFFGKKGNGHGLTEVFNVKIIVADASLVNRRLVENYFGNTSTASGGKIYISGCEEKTIGMKNDMAEQCRIKIDSSIMDTTIINLNAYPAKSLLVTYKNLISCGMRTLENAHVIKRETELNIDSQIAKDVAECILGAFPKKRKRVIVYIQDRERIHGVHERLRRILEQSGFTLENLLEDGGSGTSPCENTAEAGGAGPSDESKKLGCIFIHSDMDDRLKPRILALKDTADIVFMTSAASRGISFPAVVDTFVEIPEFSMESNLMEMVQLFYRMRGALENVNHERGSKNITVYMKTFICMDEKRYDAHASEASAVNDAIDFTTALALVKGVVSSRIFGKTALGANKEFAMVPVGSSAVTRASSFRLEELSECVKELSSFAKGHPEKKRITAPVAEGIGEMLNACSLELTGDKGDVVERIVQNGVHSGAPVYDNFQDFKRTFSGIKKLESYTPLPGIAFFSGLGIVPVKSMRTIVRVNPDAIKKLGREGFSRCLAAVREAAESAGGKSKLIGLLDTARDFFEEASKGFIVRDYVGEEFSEEDMYMMFPLRPFANPDTLDEWHKASLEIKRVNLIAQRDRGNGIRIMDTSSLFRYLAFSFFQGTRYTSLLPLDGTLYEKGCLPFLFFRAESLGNLGKRMFEETSIIASREMNLVAMLLSGDGARNPEEKR